MRYKTRAESKETVQRNTENEENLMKCRARGRSRIKKSEVGKNQM